jgi:hypothetical protein
MARWSVRKAVLLLWEACSGGLFLRILFVYDPDVLTQQLIRKVPFQVLTGACMKMVVSRRTVIFIWRIRLNRRRVRVIMFEGLWWLFQMSLLKQEKTAWSGMVAFNKHLLLCGDRGETRRLVLRGCFASAVSFFFRVPDDTAYFTQRSKSVLNCHSGSHNGCAVSCNSP